MQLVAYTSENKTLIGLLQADGTVADLTELDTFYRDPYRWIRQPLGPHRPLKSLQLRPPVPPTARVIGVGLNYRDHAAEARLPIPDHLTVFGRWYPSLAADGDAVPAIEAAFDWEAELAVVIGRKMAFVNEADGSAGVLGYAAFNDLTGRTAQVRASQWTLGKNSDKSGPMGFITTADAAGDVGRGLRIVTYVNGEIVQDGSTADMIFSIGRIVSDLSQVMTLNPGDVIATGTPAGVGASRKPPRFLKPGDVVEVQIEGLAPIRNTIVSVDR